MGNRHRAVDLDGWGILTCMSHNKRSISRHPRIWWVWSPTWTTMPKHQDPKRSPKSVVIVTTTGAQVERGCYSSRFASRTWFQQGDRSKQIYYFQKGCIVVGSQGAYGRMLFSRVPPNFGVFGSLLQIIWSRNPCDFFVQGETPLTLTPCAIETSMTRGTGLHRSHVPNTYSNSMSSS